MCSLLGACVAAVGALDVECFPAIDCFRLLGVVGMLVLLFAFQASFYKCAATLWAWLIPGVRRNEH